MWRRALPLVLGLSLAYAPATVVAQSIDELFRQGNAAQAAGNYAEAERTFRIVIQRNPNDAGAHYNLGIALRNQGKLEEAIASYRRALTIDPDDATAHNNLGFALKEQGNLEEAIASYERALAIDPDLVTARNNLREAERLLAANPVAFDDRQYVPSAEVEPLAPFLRSTARIIAQIDQGVSIGSGWVAARQGDTVWIVTCRHVTHGQRTLPSDSIEVEFFSEPPPNFDRPRHRAELVDSTSLDDNLDLAVIKVSGVPDDIQPLELRPGRIPRLTQVTIIGHPDIDETPWNAVPGTVTNYDPQISSVPLDATIATGNSGGPVLNDANEIIAMVVIARDADDRPIDPDNFLEPESEGTTTRGLGYAYRINVVLDRLRQWGISIN